MNRMKERTGLGLLYKWEHWKQNNRSGAYYLNDAWLTRNRVVNEGLDHLLGVGFAGETQKTEWYLAVFNDDYTPLAGDTYQSPGYTEETGYDGPRPTWQQGGVLTQSISNVANVAEITMTGTGTLYGGSLVSANTKGDIVSGEILYSSSQFGSERTFEATDVFRITATLNAENV